MNEDGSLFSIYIMVAVLNAFVVIWLNISAWQYLFEHLLQKANSLISDIRVTPAYIRNLSSVLVVFVVNNFVFQCDPALTSASSDLFSF